MLQNPFDDDYAPLPDEESDDVIPVVRKSPSAGKNSAAEQGRNIPMGWKPTATEPVPVVRCTGTVRNGPRKGERCPNWSLRGATVCISHGGRLPNVRKHAAETVEAARLRILGLADQAIDTLEELLDPSVGSQIRLKAATELLDRGGIKGGTEINVQVEQKASAAEEIQKRLNQIASRLNPEPEDEVEADDLENLGEVDNPPAAE